MSAHHVTGEGICLQYRKGSGERLVKTVAEPKWFCDSPSPMYALLNSRLSRVSRLGGALAGFKMLRPMYNRGFSWVGLEGLIKTGHCLIRCRERSVIVQRKAMAGVSSLVGEKQMALMNYFERLGTLDLQMQDALQCYCLGCGRR
jgi:hypothetical protein